MKDVELVERALCENNGRSGMGTMLERPGWVQVTDPNAKTDYRNLVLRSVLEADEADGRIEAAKRHFAELGVDFRWWVTPSSRPLDLAERLERHGMHLADTVIGMVAEAELFSSGGSPEIEIRRVEADDLDIYADITSRGWGSPPAARERFRRIAEAEFQTLGERATYLATYRGEPAATAGLSFLENSAHFAGSVVLPEFRGRGIYRALIEERMRIVRQRNVPI
ncbi:MAG: GNAT family N-acetyltransferase, partial [Planctomycetota bacterium]